MTADNIKQMETPGPRSPGGWLLVLCALLLLWQPVSVGLAVSSVLESVPQRGLPLVLLILVRLLVTACGIAAGLALLNRRHGAVRLAKASLVAAAATDVFVYATPYFPTNRVPGDVPLFVAGSLAYYGLWLAYLSRSIRVRATFS